MNDNKINIVKCRICLAILAEKDLETHTYWHDKLRRVLNSVVTLSQKESFINLVRDI